MQRYLISALFISALAGGCSLHSIELQQGNVIDAEAVDQLEPGMSRRQVRFIMGNPLINDPFHPARWDYIYVEEAGRPPQVKARVTVFFEGDQLARIERRGVGDSTPETID